MWLYIPNLAPQPNLSTPSLCARALAGWKQAWQSQNPVTELCVTSSGKPSQRQFSWRGWQTRPWATRLSGLTLPPSTAVRGVIAFIASLAVIPASRSHLQASAGAKPTPVTCGQIALGSSTKFDRNGVSSRTSRATSIWEPPRCSKIFAKWATAQKWACFLREKLVQASSADASSLWPTPTKSLYCNNLEMELSEAGLKFRDDPGQKGNQIALGKVARHWTMMWLLIQSVGAMPTRPFRWDHSHPLHLILRPGLRYSSRLLTFNPNFSDWMMGWPTGWTDPIAPVTAWSHWLQRMRGELSKLPIVKGD